MKTEKISILGAGWYFSFNSKSIPGCQEIAVNISKLTALQSDIQNFQEWQMNSFKVLTFCIISLNHLKKT